jgi:hypothetical protein
MDELLNLHPDMNAKIDAVQVAMEQLPQFGIKPTHIFLPGLYIREIVVPAGIAFVSKLHATAHPCFVYGTCDVADALTNSVTHVDGYWKGITMPGTRRVFNVHNETIVTTVHSVPFITGEENGYTDIEKEALALELEKIIIAEHEINT